MSKPTLVIMAAGMGSRYGGLKQLDPVGPHGEIILDYSIFDAIRAGFGKLVCIIRRDFEEAFRERVIERFSHKITAECVFQALDNLPEGFIPPPGREKPWGTGQAVLCARQAVTENFCVINADDFYGRETFDLMARFLEKTPVDQAHFAMAGYRLDRTLSEHGSVSRGICVVDESGFLTRIEERTRIFKSENGAIDRTEEDRPVNLTGAEVASMNFWGFTPALFPALEESFVEFLRLHGSDPKEEIYIPKVVGSLIAEKRASVQVIPTPSEWFGITYREDKPTVQTALQSLTKRGIYPENLWA